MSTEARTRRTATAATVAAIVALALLHSVVAAGSYVSLGDGGWECVRPTPVSAQWVDAHFIDNNTGWILSSDFRLLKTTDGGDNWAPQGKRFEKSAYDMCFADKSHGWAVGSGFQSKGDPSGVIFRTDDGGATWRKVLDGKTDGFRAVSFVNSRTGWVVGGLPSDKGIIMKTADGGETWIEQDCGIALQKGQSRVFEGVSFVDESTGWVIGTERAIYKTSDGGNTWKMSTLPGKGRLVALQFVDANTGWVLSRTLFRTTNGGKTWTEHKLGKSDYNFGLHFADSLHGTVVSNGETLRTQDGGKTWTATSGLNYGGFHPSVCMADAGHGWLVGNFAIYRTSDGASTWQPLTATDGDVALGIQFVDRKLGWAVGYTRKGMEGVGTACMVLKTSDGGETWERTIFPAKGGLEKVSFVDAKTGWALSWDGRAFSTKNGGVSWDEYSTGAKGNYWNLQFIDSNTGYAAGPGGSVLKSVDGGKTWSRLTTGTMDDLYGMFFLNKEIGWVGGVNGRIMKTTDGGSTWKRQVAGLADCFGGLCFIDEKRGWISDNKGRLLTTTDGGDTWQKRDSGVNQQLLLIRFLDGKIGWAASQPMIHTDDGGQTWTKQDYGTGLLWDMCFVDKDHGWASSGIGIIRTTTGGLPGAVWAKKQADGTQADFGHLVVTKKSAGYLLAEHPESRIGIHIKTSDQKPNVGDYIYVHGKVAKENGEKIIAADSIDIQCAGWGVLPERD